MNRPILKFLTGLALIMVILASGVVILRNVGKPDDPPGDKSDKEAGSTPGKDDSSPQVVSTGPPPVVIKGPAVIPPDHPLQPSYKPVNQPDYLQFLRQDGKTYHNKVVGKVVGRASKKDWGIRGTAYFEYLYAVESKGKILKNTGFKVVEERNFGKVHENLLVSRYEIGIELPEKLDRMFEALSYFGPKAAVVSAVGRTATAIANNVRLPVSKEWIDMARQGGLFGVVPQIDPQKLESELKMFTQGTDNCILEGKTVRIVFVDGKGIESITPVSCEISERERDVITRTNFVMDHYLFPDRKVEPGADWQVSGDVFAQFLDPRLHGKVGGEVTVRRTPDFIDSHGEVSKRLRIVKGEVVVSEEAGSRAVRGQVTSLKGVCIIPDKLGVVTSGTLHGYAEYKDVSRDHLLFRAETTVTPRIDQL